MRLPVARESVYWSTTTVAHPYASLYCMLPMWMALWVYTYTYTGISNLILPELYSKTRYWFTTRLRVHPQHNCHQEQSVLNVRTNCLPLKKFCCFHRQPCMTFGIDGPNRRTRKNRAEFVGSFCCLERIRLIACSDKISGVAASQGYRSSFHYSGSNRYNL